MRTLVILTTAQKQMCAAMVAILLATDMPLFAQSAAPGGSRQTVSGASAPDDYEVGPGDVLSITIADAPEFSGKFRVSESGVLNLPALPAPIQTAGQTPTQLARLIRDGLIDAKQLRNPTVNLFVEEFHGRNVTILGAVVKPSVYPLQRRTTVLDALSLAGGLAPNSGNTLTIVPGHGKNAWTEQKTQTIDLAQLIQGKDPSLNREVHDGDVISVSNAQVIYVVGAVNKPGGFVLLDQSSGMNALQALSMAEGFNSLASTHHGLIIRRAMDGPNRVTVPVDLAELLTGKGPDVRLEANDILYVPTSKAKQTLKVAGDVAMAAVNGIAIYGIGYRIAGLK
jgi:polysaccharide export outer membrane protein